MNYDLKIRNSEGDILIPSVRDGVTLTSYRVRMPGVLRFAALIDDELNISEGNKVAFFVDGRKVFLGYIFRRRLSADGRFWEVMACDQIRYFKNSYSLVYRNARASQVLRTICDELGLKTGFIAKTTHVIPYGEEKENTIGRIVHNALERELANNNTLYTVFDDFGEVTLKSARAMTVDSLICPDTVSKIQYSSSINSEAFNRIIAIYTDMRSGKYQKFVAKDSDRIREWGPLQKIEHLREHENGDAKAQALLARYNSPFEELKVKCFGDICVRAGSRVPVDLPHVGRKFMIAESCIHTFSGNSHMMELDLVNENKYNIRTAFMPVVEGDEVLETEGIEKGITYFSTIGKDIEGFDAAKEPKVAVAVPTLLKGENFNYVSPSLGNGTEVSIVKW
ncbi:MAG: hypothetical protein FWH05_03485 [Oscillospiraceae bacterium]|nr:hypothetical protein [Oscillospiraceae bacterium]